MKASKMKLLKRAVIILAVIFVAMQAVRPSMTSSPVDESLTIQAKTQMTPEVSAILERSCNDCHSAGTQWPWYSKVAPVSWYLARHVGQGKRALSLSEWGTYPPQKAARKLQEMCEQVERGEMPLKSYLLIHWAARLSDADKQVLCSWANQESTRLLAGQTNASR